MVQNVLLGCLHCMLVCKGCPNAVRIGFSMLDVLKWFKGSLELTSKSYTNLYIAEGTGDITETTGIKGGADNLDAFTPVVCLESQHPQLHVVIRLSVMSCMHGTATPWHCCYHMSKPLVT